MLARASVSLAMLALASMAHAQQPPAVRPAAVQSSANQIPASELTITNDELAVDQWTNGRVRDALKIWMAQAKTGDADALYNLAQAFRLGIGVKPSEQAAAGLYKKAALAGHPSANERLGILLYKDPSRRAESVEYLERAAGGASVRAHYILGVMRVRGEYVPRDLAFAQLHLQCAVDGGVESARRPLAQIRMEMTPADKSRAIALVTGSPLK
ncbi:tetratricopeptide repeat protein [Sphingomonas cavernae]|uniref:Sel1 repeat family protein n=1 Tax=Sphingomonas cavernae TaxID=2320861 RepID=A0A418WJM0_9SPHN|nr:sel1 repeat family protein [Sphingomonas cavernae]RJF90251.1 sel1 repeat family protein [Sphingomonas cavernae]